MMHDTGQLLKDMYLTAHAQATLAKDDLELAIDWAKLRERFDVALIREGVGVPPLPDPPDVLVEVPES